MKLFEATHIGHPPYAKMIQDRVDLEYDMWLKANKPWEEIQRKIGWAEWKYSLTEANRVLKNLTDAYGKPKEWPEDKTLEWAVAPSNPDPSLPGHPYAFAVTLRYTGLNTDTPVVLQVEDIVDGEE